MTFDAFRNAERNGWSERAAQYEDHTALATLQIAPALLAALRLRPGMKLLGIACGTANVAAAAQALGCNATGIDFSHGMIDAAKQRFPALDLSVGDAQDLPFDDNSFDAALCNMGLFHMTDPSRAIAEAARVLRPDGRFAWSQWTSPDDSDIYGTLFAILTEHADMSRADPAPNAYALSNPEHVSDLMASAGFTDFQTTRLETTLLATGSDFFDFFMRFGVRVPLIVAAQDQDVQATLRRQINAAMDPWRHASGWAVPMPSLVFSGRKP